MKNPGYAKLPLAPRDVIIADEVEAGMENPDPAVVIQLIEAFRSSKAMFAAVELGIFDILEEGAKDAMTLARETRSNPDALERLLDGCAGLGLLGKQGSQYSNLPVAQVYLCRNSPATLAGYILYSNRALLPMWEHLEDAVREGTHRWRQTFGHEGSIFEHFFRSDEARRDFLMGMNGFGMLSSPRIAAAFDLSAYNRLVDLGGATGHLALAVLELYPQMRAGVFDLPGAIETARATLAGTPGEGRVELIAGDFFADPLPEADLYALGRILHDWPQEKIDGLLKKIHGRLPPGGGLLIAERLLNEDKTGPLPALLQSLNMLVCTEGKERTLAEYEELLRQAGFREIRGQKIGAPLDAILAVK
ncbi:MAG TPA: class I SAM-dependent methyltransferase [Terriglobia bacterium]|nr:class I SAM-dependent methyltransferase [Terriglobia bacterium]